MPDSLPRREERLTPPGLSAPGFGWDTGSERVPHCALVLGEMTIRTTHELRVERARALRRSMRADRVLVLLAALPVVWLGAFAVATVLTGSSSTAGKAVGDIVFLVPELPIPILALLAARRRAGRVRRFWTLLACFAGLWITADTLWAVIDYVRGDVPDVSPADFLYIGSY